MGTESFIDSHASGETFVLVSGVDASRIRAEGTFSNIGQELFVKGVLDDVQDFSLITGYSVTPLGTGWEPWAPALTRVTRQANDDLLIQWEQRPRKNNNWLDAVDAIPSDADNYIVAITSTSRETTTTTNSYTYTAAEQISDWGSLVNSFSVEITQASIYTGEGLTGTFPVTVKRVVG
jgi:hypothetical protein